MLNHSLSHGAKSYKYKLFFSKWVECQNKNKQHEIYVRNVSVFNRFELLENIGNLDMHLRYM